MGVFTVIFCIMVSFICFYMVLIKHEENKKYRKVLAFYADREVYSNGAEKEESHYGLLQELESVCIEEDKGEKARKVLGGE